MNPTKRNYRATFILDNRGREETVDQLVEGVKKVIAEVKSSQSTGHCPSVVWADFDILRGHALSDLHR